MARVNTVGLTELAKEFKKRADGSRERAIKALERGAEEIAKETQVKAEEHGLRDTGIMIKSIRPGPIKLYSDSAYVEIWPHGTRAVGGKRRNAEIGFVQHYGRRYIRRHRGQKPTHRPGTYFFDEAVKSSADVVSRKMSDIWHDTK